MYVYASPLGYSEVLAYKIDVTHPAYEGYEFIEETENPEQFHLKRRANGVWVEQTDHLNNPPSKEQMVESILVTTTAGNIFNGDEKSQDRLTRAITIAGITDETSTEWKMANNEIVSVPLSELKEALTLAGKAMRDIWLA
jgi:hypothetical protein